MWKHAGRLSEHLGCYPAKVFILKGLIHRVGSLVIGFVRVLIRPSIAGLRLVVVAIVLEPALPAPVLVGRPALELVLL